MLKCPLLISPQFLSPPLEKNTHEFQYYPSRAEPLLSSGILSGVITKGHSQPVTVVSLGPQSSLAFLGQAPCHHRGANFACKPNLATPNS